MTVSCVEEIFKKYIKVSKEQYPNLFQEGNYSPHCMRHTITQHMMEVGVPIMVIKSFLGHESITTTQIYLENTQTSIDKHVKKWNQNHFNVSDYSIESDENKVKIPTFLMR